MAEQQLATIPQRQGIITKFGERYDLDANKVMSIVAQTVFKSAGNEPPLTGEEVAAALIVANAYELNPFTKEIYAFRSKGKLLIVVAVDGWSTIVNRQAQLNGIEFEEHFDDKGNIRAITCKIHRKDRVLPTVVTEYTHECRRDTIPWNTMPIRMTRNRAFIQCARIAFSISGIVDEDEAQTIEGAPEYVGSATKAIIDGATNKTQAVKDVVRKRAQAATDKGTQEPPAQAQGEQQAPAQQDAQEEKSAQPAQEAQQQTQPVQDAENW